MQSQRNTTKYKQIHVKKHKHITTSNKYITKFQQMHADTWKQQNTNTYKHTYMHENTNKDIKNTQTHNKIIWIHTEIFTNACRHIEIQQNTNKHTEIHEIHAKSMTIHARLLFSCLLYTSPSPRD